MIMRDHMGDNLYEGVIYALVLEDTHRLREEDIPQILRLFSLSRMPDFLFLISVETCNFVEGWAPDRDIFQIKIPVERVVRQVLEQEGYESITCTIANTDRIAALLGRSADDGWSADREELKALAEQVVERVKAETGGEIAITISQRCVSLDAYPAAYNACRETYDVLFTDAKTAVRFVGQRQAAGAGGKRADLNQHRATLISTISSFDEALMRQTVADIVDELLGEGLSASQIKLHMTCLISLMTDYYSDFVLDWRDIDSAGISAARIILEANYASTMKRVTFTFFWQIANNLKSSYLTREIQLRRQIDQCFECLYKDPDFNVARAAEIAGYNVSYFGKLFKKIYSTTFNGYLSEYRVNRSKALLRDTSLPIHLIAEQVGFRNYTYYYTVFKSILRVTPQQYRNKGKSA